MVASEIADAQVLNRDTVVAAVTQMVVTDTAGASIYDTEDSGKEIVLFPEIVESLNGNDVFT